MLSILIPAYNYNCTELLKKLRTQSLSSTHKIEIIVCDDASPNESIKKSNKEYCTHNHLIHIENPSNLGRTATRSTLAKTAQYDWLLFLDADVLPVSGEFLTAYTKYFSDTYQAIVGGIHYQKSVPKKEYKLRWKFGVKREARTADQRNAYPFLLASGNLLIQKETFLNANYFLGNHYGLDAFFGYQLKKLKTQILHIDNPVYHLGLENNKEFLSKSMRALETMVELEKKELIASNHTRLQQIYQSTPAKSACKGMVSLIEKPIKKNLLGSRPSLFLFDLYRLYQYIKLKTSA